MSFNNTREMGLIFKHYFFMLHNTVPETLKRLEVSQLKIRRISIWYGCINVVLMFFSFSLWTK